MSYLQYFKKQKWKNTHRLSQTSSIFALGGVGILSALHGSTVSTLAGSFEMSLINKAWEWLLSKHSLLNRQKSFKYGIPGKRHNKEGLDVKASPHRRLCKVKQAVGGSDVTTVM